MRTIKLIKCFDFLETNRDRITLGTNVRLNPTINRIQLEEDSSDEYSTDPDLYVKTWITTPQSVKQWLSFESVITHSYDDDQIQLTGHGYRLGNGTNEYWWNGASWEINTTSWNTEEEIATNITSFSVTEKSIQVIINLTTTNASYTPLLQSVKILYSSDIEFQEDIVRSMISNLKDNIRPNSSHVVTLTSDTDTIDLINDFPLKTQHDIVDIDSVFNHDTDSNHDIDIFSSYDSGTKTITLNAVQTTGSKIWIRFIYKPSVAVTTKRTYTEIGKVPCIVISDINHTAKRQGQADNSVMNNTTGIGTRVKAPSMIDIEFMIRCLTEKALDQHRLIDEIRRHFRQNPSLTSRGMDESYSLQQLGEFDQHEPFEDAEIEVGLLSCRVSNALFYNRGDETIYATKRFVISGPPNLVVS
jgi:hypothetical protein